MVESAMEFLRICEDEGFYNLVLSMKASNPQVMVQAYRLLVQHMIKAGMNYPLHLGVTEAGDGEDGRIKSAAGIGTLLEDGLGDTVRVSLTEDPEFEIPVALSLVNRYAKRAGHSTIPEIKSENGKVILPYSPYEYERRNTTPVANIGGHAVPRVIADLSGRDEITPATLFAVGYNYSVALDKWNHSEQACDFIYTGDTDLPFEFPGTLGVIMNFKTWETIANTTRRYPVYCGNEFFTASKKSAELNFIAADIQMLTPAFLSSLSKEKTAVFVLHTTNAHAMPELRRAFILLMEAGIQAPVVIKRKYTDADSDHFRLYAATDAGALLLDGLGDGIWLSAKSGEKNILQPSIQVINSTAFGTLQATRTRISKTEYISCPSCGRTLFDLQETTNKIRQRTEHLKGVKIGIMGCIVNGPGEMADADYGYVGTGPGKITLYKGKTVVKRNIDEKDAVDALISLIREHGDWVDAPARPVIAE
ncbi:MAG TPA: flavodoxin-dependent (E)-4-hydroxy-3-methylbut-2-enyl-diphosphate synthase, partial [Bacteroidia bacterium]|nr:flavodoxin-dependent (E)-4-hydroxy-3-methylbut-2-enyl-diphosphate synthase [Bacteroidia bacterium]